MTEADFRNAIRGVLRQHDQIVEAAIRRELARPITLGHRERFQFEVDPWGTYGIHLVQTEEGILEGVPLPESLYQAGEESDVDLHAMLGEELFPWLADRWHAVAGPGPFIPAYPSPHP